jgi:RNA-directed DNA polymerase
LNRGNLRRRCEAKGTSRQGEADSSDAPPRDGAARSSDEAAVTAAERRGGVIQQAWEINRATGRTGDHPEIQFTFLGYTFRPRKAVDKYDRVCVNFSPAVSRDALKAMRQTIRGWHLRLKSDKSMADLSAMFDPILRGWQRYYGGFYGSALKPVWRSMNLFLIRWLMRKHKPLAGHKTRAAEMLMRMANGQPGAFIH